MKYFYNYCTRPRSIKRTMLMLVVVLLSSCGGNKGDDLDKFMEDASKDMQIRVDPLPEVRPYVPIPYNEDGTLNDPFKPRKAQVNQGSQIQPNLSRTKEPLEAFPLENLKYVGSLFKEKLKYALIKAPDKTIQQVRVGNYMGQNFGVVTEIDDESLQLKEIVQDPLTGDWTERTASMTLQE